MWGSVDESNRQPAPYGTAERRRRFRFQLSLTGLPAEEIKQ
jgi:hypothetical protein